MKQHIFYYVRLHLISYQMLVGHWWGPLVGDRFHWCVFGNWNHIDRCGADINWHRVGFDRRDTAWDGRRAGSYAGSWAGSCTGSCASGSTSGSSCRLHYPCCGSRGHQSGGNAGWNDVCSGRTGQGDGDHVAFVAGDAILFQLGNEASVLCVLEQLSNLLVLLRVHLHVVLRQATFAISADFSTEDKMKQLESNKYFKEKIIIEQTPKIYIVAFNWAAFLWKHHWLSEAQLFWRASTALVSYLYR